MLQLLQLLALLFCKNTLAPHICFTNFFGSLDTWNPIRWFFLVGHLSGIIFVWKQGLFTFSEFFLLLAQLQLDLGYLNLVLLPLGLHFLNPATHILELKMRPSFGASVLLRVLVIKVYAFVVDHFRSVIILD